MDISTAATRDATQRIGVGERGQAVALCILDEIKRLASQVAGHELGMETRLTDTGLDSLGGLALIGYVERQFGVSVHLAALLGSATIGDLVMQVTQTAEEGASNDGWRHSPLQAQAHLTCAVFLRDWRIAAPLFLVPGLNGTPYYLQPLCKALDALGACVAFQAPGMDGAEAPLGSVEEMARRYIKEMRAIQPHGPYAIAGHSFGGLVALEMAQVLMEQGEDVAPLMMLDTTISESEEGEDQGKETMALFEVISVFRRFSKQPPLQVDSFAEWDDDRQRQLLRKLVEEYPGADQVVAIYRKNFMAMMRYRPRRYPGQVLLLRSKEGFPMQTAHPRRRVRHQFHSPNLGWDRFCSNLRVIDVSGDHFTMVLPPHARTLAAAMQGALTARPAMSFGIERLQVANHAPVAGRALVLDQESVHFNPLHPDCCEDPYPYFNQVREHAAVFQDSLSHWWITRYEDVSAALRDKSLSVDTRQLDPARDVGNGSAMPSPLSGWARRQEGYSLARLYNSFMLFTDPPRHAWLRKLFSPAFSAEAVLRLTHRIDERIDSLISDMRAKPEPDLMRDLALPLPVGVISSIYGVPEEDAALLAGWARDLGVGLDIGISQQAMQRAEQSAMDFTHYLREHVERLRKAPSGQGDTRLPIEAMLDQGISVDELIANMAMSYFAGFETTTNAIGNGTLALLRYLDQFDALRHDPALIEKAVEELLRYDAPVPYAVRYAIRDIEIVGHHIPRGGTLLLMLGAANRDPAVFVDPDRLDITRDARHHVAFSHGIHYCLGAALARLELQRVFLALARQHFWLVPGRLKWRKSFGLRGLDQFGISWEAPSRG